jgi:hypothetical protein
LKHHRPLSLWPTIHEPDPQDEREGSTLLYGYIQIIKLYRQLDEKFFSLWNNTTPNTWTDMWIEDLQARIDEPAPAMLEYLEVSAVDLIVSRYWLRVMIWRLQTRLPNTGTGANVSLQFKHLLDICRDVVQQLSNFTRTTLEIHGLDLVSDEYQDSA